MNRGAFRPRNDIIPRPFFILMTSMYTVPRPAWMTVIREAHTNQAQPHGIPPYFAHWYTRAATEYQSFVCVSQNFECSPRSCGASACGEP